MTTRRGKAMVQRPYVPESVQDRPGQRHALIRRLGARALTHPALQEIMEAADRIASEHGITVDSFSDEQADRAIALGEERHSAQQ